MIVSRTPFRISLFGGGTDYRKWFEEHGGAVLGFAINKYCYISVRHLPPFFEHRHRVVYSKVENVNDICEIQHPAVRAVLEEEKVDVGLEIHHDADLPARSGIGSSSSFTVGLLNALRALRGKMIAPSELAREAIRIEQDVIKESVGCQDQIWAAHGGLNRIDFLRNGDYSISPILLAPAVRKELNQSMMLFFTGLSRYASEYAQAQIDNVGNRTSELREMQAMVDQAVALLSCNQAPIRELGRLLHESWTLKRRLASGVTNSEIDAIYEAGRAAGALGGKLLGAGGGGFMLFVVERDHQENVLKALDRFVHVKFDIEEQGSRIVIYQPNGFS
jgi:D-glycero-alpha-D-manno-heptose-7-phosphate kinase